MPTSPCSQCATLRLPQAHSLRTMQLSAQPARCTVVTRAAYQPSGPSVRPAGPRRATTARSGQVQQQTDETSQQDTAASHKPSIVDFFLNRAASSLQRGVATCTACKGLGALECPQCHGQGVLGQDQARKSTVKHAVQKFQGILGVERQEYKTDYMMSNRCRCCHGQGTVTCPQCQGVGVRAPGVRPLKQ